MTNEIEAAQCRLDAVTDAMYDAAFAVATPAQAEACEFPQVILGDAPECAAHDRALRELRAVWERTHAQPAAAHG